MKYKNSAFSLVEILVAIVIGVISIAAAFASYTYFTKSYKSVSERAELNRTARQALSIITRDLRNAGFKDVNKTTDQDAISVNQKYLDNIDSLSIIYSTSSNKTNVIDYRPIKKSNGDVYLEREGIEFVSNLVDFQVVLKDKDGAELFPVCYSCGSQEKSQGSENIINGIKLGKANQKKVHTAEVYLTVKSSNEIYGEKKKIIITNHIKRNGNVHTNGNTQTFDDRFLRETFFVSVHARNLATNIVSSTTTGQSIGQTSSYNK
jgi:type II secretory pathway pseudopilin PulG